MLRKVDQTTSKTGQECYFIDGKRVCRDTGRHAVARKALESKSDDDNQTMSHAEAGEHVMQMLRTENLKIDACRAFGPFATDIRVLSKKEKDSVSDTIIAFGKLNNVGVSLKISFSPRESKSGDRNAFEREFYRRVSPSLAEYTPHTVPYIGQVSCLNFVTNLKQEREAGTNRTVGMILDAIDEGIDKESFNLEEAFMIFTIQTSGQNITNVMKSLPIDHIEHFLDEVLFQLAWTVKIFALLGIMHNDLHEGNIFVETLKSSRSISYRLGANTFVRKSRFVVYLFDYDLSSKSATRASNFEITNNSLKDYLCDEAGVCDEFTTNQDWFRILYGIRNTLLQIQQKQKNNHRIAVIEKNLVFIEDLTGSTLNHDPNSFADKEHLCQFQGSESNPCRILKTDLLTMTSPSDFINSPKYYRSVTTGFKDNRTRVFTLPSTEARKPATYRRPPKLSNGSVKTDLL
jgi:hypothetical protein